MGKRIISKNHILQKNWIYLVKPKSHPKKLKNLKKRKKLKKNLVKIPCLLQSQTTPIKSKLKRIKSKIKSRKKLIKDIKDAVGSETKIVEDETENCIICYISASQQL